MPRAFQAKSSQKRAHADRGRRSNSGDAVCEASAAGAFPDRKPGGEPATRPRCLGRAGFGYQVAAAIIDAEDADALAEMLAEIRRCWPAAALQG